MADTNQLESETLSRSEKSQLRRELPPLVPGLHSGSLGSSICGCINSVYRQQGWEQGVIYYFAKRGILGFLGDAEFGCQTQTTLAQLSFLSGALEGAAARCLQ